MQVIQRYSRHLCENVKICLLYAQKFAVEYNGTNKCSKICNEYQDWHGVKKYKVGVKLIGVIVTWKYT